MAKNTQRFSIVDEKISNLQFVYLIIMLVLTTADVFPPSIIAALSGKDAWVAVILSTVTASLIMSLYITLGTMHQDKTIMEYSTYLLGRVLGKMIGLIYIGYFIYIGAIVLRELGEILRSAFLPTTPITAVLIIATALLCYGVYCGFEVITRVNEWLFFLGIGLLQIVIILAVPMADFSEYLPVFENGIMPSIKGAIVLLSYFGESVITLMIYPSIRDKSRTMQAGIFSIFCLGVVLEMGTIAIAVFGVIGTSRMLYPALELVRMINYANFLQRLDATILAIWTAGIVLKLLLIMNTANTGVCQLVGLKDPKPTIIPIGLLILTLSELFFDNVTDVYYYLMNHFTYTLSVTIGIPVLLFIVSLIKRQMTRV
ncbi:spore germination protein KB [Caldanaerobius fijiensis DSM 17918]|uniref:Spore germination protein KB n=1 Tax=Caldanaerobius fijiensis DSM 17918 TaxID=1121256 RepID=A0A1M4ZF18_9THEO|nr:endospore germination permease [Caldanaerobius fijiensis]SHF16545.1 spore germination protein KB [Caldanaerobius fijiensis DSM 17918]